MQRYLKSALMFEFKEDTRSGREGPPHPKVGENNVRSGFLEFVGYEKALAELPPYLKCIFVIGYYIGNRKGALLKLKWAQRTS